MSVASLPAISLLQSFRVQVDGHAVQLPASAQRVVAFLALHGRPVRRLHVAGSLWLDYPEDCALANLRTLLWRVRRMCPGLVESQGAQLSLAAGVLVDVREATAVARRLIAGEQTPGLADDLRVFGAGDLLPDWYEDWVEIERERFRQLRLHALETHCDQLTAVGSFGRAAEAGFAAVASEPLRESAHRAVIRLHLAAGNRNEAVRQLELYRRLLKAGLGVAPSGAIEQLVRSGLAEAA